MAVEGVTGDLIKVVSLLGASVVAVPLFRRFGLGSVLGYFSAGLVIGPYGIGLFGNPESVLHVAEFGVVMFLFVIGLEMQPSRLWNLRREIFGLGVAQVCVCGALLTSVGLAAGLPFAPAFIAGMGFVLSSTAVVMQMLNERGETSTPSGQQALSILLLEDLAIVPLLAIVTLLAPSTGDETAGLRSFALAVASIAGLILAGRYLLNPLFRLLAASHAREIMSILLGLFFLAVGMSLDLAVVSRQWLLICGAVAAFMAVKALGIFITAKLFKATTRAAITRVALFSQGGEFAFVLYAAALSTGIFDAQVNAVASATVIISMALTPLLVILLDRFLPAQVSSMEGIDVADGLQGSALVIGFGRFGQVASQSLLARGFSVSIIETDVELIKTAADFGFKVYYGDGTRPEILHASGADKSSIILVGVNDRATADKIVHLAQTEFAQAQLFVRAYDRGHAMDLIRVGVDYQIRETFESAMLMGHAMLLAMGVPQEEADEISADVRRRDQERLDLQVAGDLHSGSDLVSRNTPTPVPLTKPKTVGQVSGPVPGLASNLASSAEPS
jgi:glutathione-regulated potassium-efflux system protein KefB